jgi:hypothetical protein
MFAPSSKLSATLGRPSAPPTLPRDQLDSTIRPAFLPGLKHGICHHHISNEQLMTGCIVGNRKVGS